MARQLEYWKSLGLTYAGAHIHRGLHYALLAVAQLPAKTKLLLLELESRHGRSLLTNQYKKLHGLIKRAGSDENTEPSRGSESFF